MSTPFGRRVVVSALVVAALASLRPSFAQDVYPVRQYPVGVFPKVAIITDIDGDTVPDIVVSNQTSSFLSVLKGVGNGLFVNGTDIALGTAAGTTFAMADYSGDGNSDFVTGSSTILQLVQGLGGGLFGPSLTIGAGGTPVSIAVANVNGDAFPDIIVATTIGNLSIRMGLGGGVFAAPVITPFGLQPSAHTSMARGDFNADGLIDLAVTNFTSGTVSILSGNGTGGFSAPLIKTTGANPWAVATGDFNLDGWLDIVTASRTPTDAVTVHYNNSLGGFFGGIPFPAGADPRSVAVGDSNGDGWLDLFVADSGLTDGGVSVLMGAPGTFEPAVLHAVGVQPFYATVGDLNGDSQLDLVVLNTNSYAVSVAMGDGFGSFVTTPTFPTGTSPRVLAVRDFTGDGLPDAYTANTNQFMISTTPADGPNSFGTSTTTPLTGSPRSVAEADVNNDGLLDLLVAIATPARVTVFVGTGGGSFAAPVHYNLPSPARAVDVADLNADGRPDMVVAHETTNNVSVLLGQPSGTFGVLTAYPTGTAPSSIAIGDMNADGKPDLVTGDNGTVSILLGDGTGAFAAPVSTAITGASACLVLGDVNGDGLRDVAMAIYLTKNFAVLLNSPGAVLQAPTYYPVGTFPGSNVASVTIGDINYDGKPDLVSANGYFLDGSLSVYIGDGTGAFAPAHTFGLRNSPAWVQLADMDLDGDLDVVASLEGGSRLSIVTNQHTDPLGTVRYGTGTHGCAGIIGMTTNSVPTVNNTTFAFLGSNLPKNRLAVLLGSDSPDLPGTDYFGLLFKMHLNPITSTFFLGLNFPSDASGAAYIKVPIDNNPVLAGMTFYVQALGVEAAGDGEHCTPALYSLVTSIGLSLTIQP